MTAAMDIAKQDVEVHLIEKEKELGGNLRNLRFLADGTDPAKMLEKMITDLDSYENLHVHTETKIVDAEGFVGNFKTVIVENGEKQEIEHGAIIVAAGAKQYTPTEYNYGQDERVLTQVELQDKLAKGDFNANKVVMIQCIGSRNEEFPNCSRVCCTNAVTNALQIKKLKPETEVYIINKDIRTFGFKEDYFRDANAKGVIFLRYDDDNKPILDDDFNITINDNVLDQDVVIHPDLLVLSAGIHANPDNGELGKIYKLPLSKDDFFLEAHMKLRPVDFATEGAYLCGLSHWPKFIDESISQASGAASRALTILSKEKLEAEGIVASVTERICVGCGVCEGVCEYKAISLIPNPKMPNREVANVNEGVCKGCGACVGACPSGAINQRGFKNGQLNKMIDAFLETISV